MSKKKKKASAAAVFVTLAVDLAYIIGKLIVDRNFYKTKS